MAEFGVLGLATAQHWFVRHQLPDGSYTIEPLACWALVAESTSFPDGPTLVGMVAQAQRVVPVPVAGLAAWSYVWAQGWNISEAGIRRLPGDPGA